MGEDVPYRKLGFPSLNAFIETIPDTIRIGRLVLSRRVDIVSQKITWCLKYISLRVLGKIELVLWQIWLLRAS